MGESVNHDAGDAVAPGMTCEDFFLYMKTRYLKGLKGLNNHSQGRSPWYQIDKTVRATHHSDLVSMIWPATGDLKIRRERVYLYLQVPKSIIMREGVCIELKYEMKGSCCVRLLQFNMSVCERVSWGSQKDDMEIQLTARVRVLDHRRFTQVITHFKLRP